LGVDLVRAFGLGETPVTIDMEPLTRRRAVRSAVTEVVDDEQKAAISDWLQGRPVNRQLLRGLRRGTARWLRATIAPDLLHRDGVAKPHGVLRWQHTCLDTTPCICLEAVDDESLSVLLARAIGPVAFDLYRYATATGDEAKHLLAQLAGEPLLLPAQLAAADLRRKAISRLEVQLGISVEYLSLQLYVLLCLVEGQPAGRVPGFSDEFWAQPQPTCIRASPRAAELAAAGGDAICRLFDDWFRLRENVFDGQAVERLLNGRTLQAVLTPLVSVNSAQVDRDYWLGKQRLSEVLTQACSLTEEVLTSPAHGEATLSPIVQNWLVRFHASGEQGLQLSELPVGVLADLQANRPDLCSVLRIIALHQDQA
jgi:hypothetical protein